MSSAPPADILRPMSPTPPASPTIALVGPEVEENLSLRYLASAVERDGWRAEIFPFNCPCDLPLLVDLLTAEPLPDVIALSLSFQWRASDVLALAVALRERGYAGHITAGGHFGSFEWSKVLTDFPELDSLCRFEADETLPALCGALRLGEPLESVSGLVVRDPNGTPHLTAARESPDLDTLPWPDRRGPSARCVGHPIAAMIGSRGCYGNCSFCCIATLHRHASPSKRHRLRPVEDVADEMAHLSATKGTEIFIFHDDDFFLPRKEDSLRRIEALGEALRVRRLPRIATVVKARPNDISREVCAAMKEQLGLVRLFLGVESSTTQGVRTLGRGVAASRGSEAIALLEELELYVCFNMLVFDPDAGIDALLENMDFIERHGDHPSNFGRVELYAGTPLLERLQREGRAEGDYLAWSYDQATPEMQRVFELTMTAFHERNFSGRALANRLQSTRFDVEVARHFHPAQCRPDWIARARGLSRRLAASSARGVRAIVHHVRGSGVESDETFIASIAEGLRRDEDGIESDAVRLEQEVYRTIGAGCDHAPAKGIPIPREGTQAPRFQATVIGCNVAT